MKGATEPRFTTKRGPWEPSTALYYLYPLVLEKILFYHYLCILWEETMTITAEQTERQQGQQHGASCTNITLNATKPQFQQHTLK